MSRITLILITVIMLAGCGQTIERMQRKAQAEKIVERTITKPETSVVVIQKYKELPPELLVPCKVTYKNSYKVKEYVRVADTNTAYAEACKEQMDSIIKLQTKK